MRLLVEDIGADVNVGGGRGGEGGEVVSRVEVGGEQGGRSNNRHHTPICLAVLSEKKSMVELLLDLGATHVHPALRLARELELDDITGLLLKNLSLDRNGETVNLSGLELQSVKPQWILPCLGVNETLRLNLQRRRSFDRIKDLLSRRKSIGCIEDKNLELLRTKMETLLRENGEGFSSGADGESPCVDEPDFDLPEASSHVLSHRRTRSGNASIDLAELKPTSLLTPPQTRRENGSRSRSVPPEELQLEGLPLPRLSLPTTPTKSPGLKSTSTPIKHRAPPGMSLGFQPTLPPICGTPVGSLQRFSIQSASSHSSSDIMDSPTSPLVPPSPIAVGAWLFPGDRRSSRGTLVMSAGSDSPHQPRTPQRRHHEKLNSLMIQKTSATQRELFPVSPSHPLPQPTAPLSIDTDRFKPLNTMALIPKKVSNMSPSILLRRMSLWGKKQAKPGVIKRPATPGSSFSRPSSPPARIFTDLTIQSMSGDSRDSTPVLSDFKRPRSLARVPTNEGIGTGQTPIPTGNGFAARVTPNGSGFPLSPGSDSTDGGDGSLFSPTSSSTTATFSHRRRRPSSSLSSSSSIPASPWSEDSRAAENSLVFAAKFASRASSEVREKITSARLVKVLDLSSNSLVGLEKMVGEEGEGGREERERGEMVCQRLRGLQRLDLKQNRLSRLPRCLMRELMKLSILNLSCNGFEELPAESVFSPALTSLDLSTNRVYTHTYAFIVCL